MLQTGIKTTVLNNCLMTPTCTQFPKLLERSYESVCRVLKLAVYVSGCNPIPVSQLHRMAHTSHSPSKLCDRNKT